MESYVYNLRNTLRKLEAAVNETTNWLDVSQKASKEEYEDRKAELETLAQYECFHFFLSISCFYSPYLYIDGPFLQAAHLAVFLVALVVVNLVGFPDASDDSCTR